MSNRSRKKKARRPLSARQRLVRFQQLALIGGIVLLIVCSVLIIMKIKRARRVNTAITAESGDETLTDVLEPDFSVQLLTPNEYSRPGIATEQIRYIVIHYTANPESTAQDNRDYFEGLMNTHATHASSHFIIGLEGEVIQCIPTSEIAYASNDRNGDSVSIECCHPDESGAFTPATYRSMVQTTAWLCSKFGLTGDDVIRHYDITGKDCPRYFVEHEDAFIQFKQDVNDMLAAAQEALGQ